ncbi:hypothetical protein [Nonomuraea typhae]|uniref:Uncharacterized protein n=1 Tax=Nonomuraea typhae TaxID=2603600 RepID=A0ABW7YLT5_9ACTN
MPAAEIYIELVVNFAEDPKVRSLLRHGADVRGLRDLYVQMALYAKRNLSDGFVPEEEVGILVYPDTWDNGLRDAERLVQARLLERVEGGFVVRAFAKRNRTKAEVMRLAEDKAAGGTLGNHIRWHEQKGRYNEACPHCRSDRDRTTDRTTDPGTDSHSESLGSDEDATSGDQAAFEAAGEAPHLNGAGPSHIPGIDADLHDHKGDPIPIGGASRERSPETETETKEKNPPTPQGGKRRKRRSNAEDYDSDPDFVRFWDVYPEKGGKFDAFKAWQAAVARGDNPELIIQAAVWFRDDPRRDPERTKWAQGWLNGRRYKEQKPTRPRNPDQFWEN